MIFKAKELIKHDEDSDISLVCKMLIKVLH